MAIVNRKLIDASRPARCDLHSDPEYEHLPYVCNLKWSALESLMMDAFPPLVIVHMEEGSTIDSFIASICLVNLEIRRDEVMYHMYQESYHEWHYFLWQTIALTELVEPHQEEHDLESRYEIRYCPTPEAYVSELVRSAIKNGFEVTNNSGEGEIDVYLRKKPATKSGSVLEWNGMVGEFRQVNKEMLEFLAERIVLLDLATDEEVRFADDEVDQRVT